MSKNAFERSIVGEMPLHEAADFFIKLKHAGWSNPPAEPAEVEQQPVVKHAVSNRWVAEHAINGLDSRALKAGVHNPFPSKHRKELLEHAMGGVVDSHAHQAKAVKKLNETVVPHIAQRAKEKATVVAEQAATAKKKRTIKAAVGGVAAGTAIGAGAVAVKRHQEKNASSVIDALLRSEMPEGKGGHFKLAMRMKLAAAKLAAPAPNDMPLQDDSQATPVANDTPVDNSVPQPAQPEPIPGDYVQNELSALAAQNANEAAFYRSQVESSQQQTEQLQQQVEQMQQQLGQIQNQSAVAGVQVQSLTNQATQANDRALQYSSETANIRMGVQKMREALMQLASQDPAAMGALSEMDQQQQAQEQEAQQVGPDGQPVSPPPGQEATASAQPGTPENSPAPGGGTPPGAAGADAGGANEQQPEAKSEGPKGGADDTAKTQISIKNASAAPWMAGGAVLGALDGLHGANKQVKQIPHLEGHVQELEEAEGQGSTFEQAVALARAKADLDQARLTQKYPKESKTRAAFQGGKTGLMLGSSLHGGIGDVKDAWREFSR